MILIIYFITVILFGFADWVFAREFNPDMNTKQRVVSAVKFGFLWPLYLIKQVLVEFL